MASIFISHSSRNNDRAIAVRDWLTRNGWDDIFLDLDPERGIVAGQRWKEALQRAAHRCELVLALVSADWLASGWCKSEVDAARLMGKEIIVALIGIDKRDVPLDLTDEQWVDLDHDPDGYRRLKAGLKRAGLDPSSFALEPGRRPYPGFAYLEEKDAAVFFGRDAQVIRGLDRMRSMVRTGVDRMMVIVGASGSGKSSFLRAGLWARLKRDDRNWLPLPPIRPERAAISGKFGLAQALQLTASEPPFAERMRALGLPRSRAEIQEFIAAADDGLTKIFAALREAAQSPGLPGESAQPPVIVLAIDQGEELFNPEGGEESRRFTTILAHTLKADARALAVMAMRSDAFPLLQAQADLAALSKDTFPLDMMLEGSYRAVIEGPARLVEPPLEIDPQLTDALLEDVSGQDALPLLAFTLAHLHEQYAVDNRLTLGCYEKLGRLKGIIDTTVRQAFAEGAARGELPKDEAAQLALARTAFIPHMAQVNAAGQFVRRVALRDEIPAAARPVIERFADQRLLIKDRRGGVDVVEVAHEALLRQPPLSLWLAEDREFLIWRERLAQARAAFDSNQRGLLAGRELEIARSWQQARAADDIDAADQNFIAASIAEDDRRRSEEAERERRHQAEEKEEQERRLRDAQRIAEEQGKAAAAQQRAARNARIGSVIAGLVAVVAVAMAVLAGLQYRQAQKEAKLATAREYAAQSRDGLDVRAPQNLVLALKSVAMTREVDAFSPTGARQLLHDLLSQTGGLPLRHAGPVAALRLSPDDRWLATASGGDIALRDMRDPAAAPVTLHGSDGRIHAIAFSADGETLAAVGADSRLRLWRLPAGDRAAATHTLSGHAGPVVDVAFSRSARFIATAGSDQTARLWDRTATDLETASATLPHEAAVNTLAFSADDHWLATGSADGAVRLWDLTSPDPSAKPVRLQAGEDIRKVAFSADNQWLVAGDTESHRVFLVRLSATDVPFSLPVDQWVSAVAFSPDGRWLATPAGYAARLWDLSKPDPSFDPLVLPGHRNFINDVAFSADGKLFATASEDNTVQLWTLTDRFAAPVVLRGHAGAVRALAFTRDGRLLATASDDRTARLWSTSSPSAEPLTLQTGNSSTALKLWDLRSAQGPAPPRILGDDLAPGSAAAFSPNGKWLAAIPRDDHDVIPLWDLSAAQPTSHLLHHPGDIAAEPAFSPDGRWLATGGWGTPTIRLWDLTAPDPARRPQELRGHRGGIRSLAFAASGRLVSGADDGRALVWDLPATGLPGRPRALSAGGASGTVRVVAISPDGRRVATGAWEPDFSTRIFDLSEPLSAMNPITVPFKDRVFDVALSPDGRWAAAGSWDRTVALVDLTHPGGRVFRLQGHGARTLSIAFSPDSRWLASGNEDRTARLWDLTAADPSASAVVLPIPYGGAAVAFSPDGRWLAISATELRSNPFSPDSARFAAAGAQSRLYRLRLKELFALACRTAAGTLAASDWSEQDLPPSTEVCSL